MFLFGGGKSKSEVSGDALGTDMMQDRRSPVVLPSNRGVDWLLSQGLLRREQLAALREAAKRDQEAVRDVAEARRWGPEAVLLRPQRAQQHAPRCAALFGGGAAMRAAGLGLLLAKIGDSTRAAVRARETAASDAVATLVDTDLVLSAHLSRLRAREQQLRRILADLDLRTGARPLPSLEGWLPEVLRWAVQVPGASSQMKVLALPECVTENPAASTLSLVWEDGDSSFLSLSVNPGHASLHTTVEESSGKEPSAAMDSSLLDASLREEDRENLSLDRAAVWMDLELLRGMVMGARDLLQAGGFVGGSAVSEALLDQWAVQLAAVCDSLEVAHGMDAAVREKALLGEELQSVRSAAIILEAKRGELAVRLAQASAEKIEAQAAVKFWAAEEREVAAELSELLSDLADWPMKLSL